MGQSKNGQLVYNIPNASNNMTTDEMQQGLIGTESSYKIQGIVTKLGIQGTPGLKFIANKQPFYIGRTGIFEVEGVEIKSLTIEPVETYSYDEEKTQANQKKVLERYKELAVAPYPLDTWDEKEIIAYHEMLNKFIISVNEVESNYLYGINGVYNKDPDGAYGTIIIDYEYTTEGLEGGTTT